VRWLFGPLVSWWHPIATKAGESWHRLQGGALTLPKGANPYAYPGLLVFSEELWAALESDPLPYRLLNFIEQDYPALLKDECYGIRLARVEDLLQAGKQQGLSAANDLGVYVLALLEAPVRAEESRWQEALRMAAAGLTSLDAYFAS
jgi:hypothetical protein